MYAYEVRRVYLFVNIQLNEYYDIWVQKGVLSIFNWMSMI